MLINSANLMGGSSEPDGDRGFGRVHLEAGLPLDGAGFRGLLVVDSSTASVAEGTNVDYTFVTDSSDSSEDDAVEFRATLAWTDPPASSVSTRQLVNDLDLEVVAPSGNRYTMWGLDGDADSDNVIERVIISADDFAAEESGRWTVTVSAADVLVDGSQSYSLVVLGPFGDGTDLLVEDDGSAAPRSHGQVGGLCGVFSLALLLPLVARAGAGLLAQWLCV